MASSDGTQKNSAEKFNIQKIKDEIDKLLRRLPTVEQFATQLTPNNTDRNSVSDGNPNNGNTGGNIPSINGGYSNQKNEIYENNNGQNVSNQDPCARICTLLSTLLTFGSSADNKENNSEAKDSVNSSSSNDSSNQSKLERIRKTLTQVNAALTELKKLEEDELGKRIQPHLRRVDAILGPQAPAPADSSSFTLTEANLREISKEIMKIKNQIPSLLKLSLTGPGSYNNSETIKNSDACSAFHGKLNPHNSKSFLGSSFYDEIKEIYDGLGRENEKFFLSCFAMLPENDVVKRRLLTYWWVGEGLVETEGETAEIHVDQILKRFREKGLIKPAKKELRGKAKSYRMDPLVRSVVIKLSEKKFFAFNDNGILTGNLSDSSNKRACVTKSSVPLDTVLTKEQKQEDENFDKEWKNLNQENLITIFNVNEPFPDLKLQLLAKKKELSVVEWLSKMKNVKVLYLGRWQKSTTYHIEVESIEFLKGLKSMKELRLLSLQGISRINELPSSLGKLSNLRILDVKACHNLEELPQEISRLKELRYLDVSDCYMLDRMPKGLSSLSKLQVLKGYVIGNPQSGSFGTLDDLKDLKRLRKLTISASGHESPTSKGPVFPTSKDLVALNRLGNNGALRKLTLAWGSKQGGSKEGGSKQGTDAQKPPKRPSMLRRMSTKSSNEIPEAKLPEKLEKLDLQCYPGTEIPSWLVPSNMKSLKKLFIRGGELETLKNDKWTVETLCLKYLIGMKIDWIQLQQRFPNLAYLENVGCPRITFCPCDEDGVWKKPKSN